jgi:uncharacterized membrane-anchored protein YitT (DUF2179 family)
MSLKTRFIFGSVILAVGSAGALFDTGFNFITGFIVLIWWILFVNIGLYIMGRKLIKEDKLADIRDYYSSETLYFSIEINPMTIRMRPPLVSIPEDFL